MKKLCFALLLCSLCTSMAYAKDVHYDKFADSKTGEYPVYVDFRISYEGEYYKENTLAKMMEATEIKEKTPIGPVEYNYDDDDDDDGDLRAVSDEETALKSIAENNSLKTNVEFVEDEFVPTDEDEETKLWKSEDPFLKKDPNDYSSNNETDEN